MVYSPVGIKCKDCARPSKSMLRSGKPSQYMGALLAGILSSVFGGIILMFIFRSILLNIILGLLIGEAVRRGARGNRGPVFAVIAGGSAFLGLVIAGYALSPMGFVFTLIVAGIAAYRLAS